jgi:hypothetical protein
MQTGVKGQKVGKQLPDVDISDEVVDTMDTIRTPQIDPESVQLRSERYTVDLNEGKGKGGGGRKVADYSGSGITSEAVRQIQTGGVIQNPQGRLRQTTGRYRDYDLETGGAPQAPFQDDSLLTGSKKDIYGTRLASLRSDSDTARPTQLVGKVKGPQTQKPTAAMRGESGTRTVNIAENIRHLSDPTWLASQGYDLNKVSPQQLVGEYLQRLQSKTGSSDLQQYLQRRGRKN